MTTPPITALDREAAADVIEALAAARALTNPDAWLLSAETWRRGHRGYEEHAYVPEIVARHRTAAERATSPAGDAGEVERIAVALCNADPDPAPLFLGAYHIMARAALAALLPQAGDADVVGEPGA